MSTTINRTSTRIITGALSLALGAGSLLALIYDLQTLHVSALLPSIGFALFLTTFLLSAAGGFVPWNNDSTARLVTGALWGAGFAILGAIYGEPAMWHYLTAHVGALPPHFDVTVQAPIVEEIMKSLGVLLILAVNRGRGDAFLIALTIGLGFGTVENIQYFTNALVADGWTRDFFVLLISRGLMGPCLHAVCVGILGLTLAWGARKSIPVFARIPLGVVAIGAGMVLHSWSNGAFGLANLYVLESGTVVFFGALLVIGYRRLVHAAPLRFLKEK